MCVVYPAAAPVVTIADLLIGNNRPDVTSLKWLLQLNETIVLNWFLFNRIDVKTEYKPTGFKLEQGSSLRMLTGRSISMLDAWLDICL